MSRHFPFDFGGERQGVAWQGAFDFDVFLSGRSIMVVCLIWDQVARVRFPAPRTKWRMAGREREGSENRSSPCRRIFGTEGSERVPPLAGRARWRSVSASRPFKKAKFKAPGKKLKRPIFWNVLIYAKNLFILRNIFTTVNCSKKPHSLSGISFCMVLRTKKSGEQDRPRRRAERGDGVFFFGPWFHVIFFSAMGYSIMAVCAIRG